jgi:hypothetical protein
MRICEVTESEKTTANTEPTYEPIPRLQRFISEINPDAESWDSKYDVIVSYKDKSIRVPFPIFLYERANESLEIEKNYFKYLGVKSFRRGMSVTFEMPKQLPVNNVDFGDIAVYKNNYWIRPINGRQTNRRTLNDIDYVLVELEAFAKSTKADMASSNGARELSSYFQIEKVFKNGTPEHKALLDKVGLKMDRSGQAEINALTRDTKLGSTRK